MTGVGFIRIDSSRVSATHCVLPWRRTFTSIFRAGPGLLRPRVMSSSSSAFISLTRPGWLLIRRNAEPFVIRVEGHAADSSRLAGWRKLSGLPLKDNAALPPSR